MGAGFDPTLNVAPPAADAGDYTTAGNQIGNYADTAEGSPGGTHTLFAKTNQILADLVNVLADIAATHTHAAGAETQATAAAGDAATAADAATVCQDGSPTLVTPDLAAGTTLTDGGVAWTHGALAQLRAAGGANPYRVVALAIDTPSAGDIFQIQLYQGAVDTPCGATAFEIATDAGGLPVVPVDSGRIPAGARLRASVATASGGGVTIGVRAIYQELP